MVGSIYPGGPSQVVRACFRSSLLLFSTQATCPSGLMKTADGGGTSPMTGSSQPSLTMASMYWRPRSIQAVRSMRVSAGSRLSRMGRALWSSEYSLMASVSVCRSRSGMRRLSRG